MPQPSTPLILAQRSQDALIDFCKTTSTAAYRTFELRSRFEYIDKEYIRENVMVDQHNQSKAANQVGNKRKLQDIVIPVVEPQVETAHAYLTSVFCTGNPIFGVVSNAENIDQAKQMEAVIAAASTRGGWARQLMLFFRDGLKYNFHALEVSWCTEKIYSLSTDATFAQGKEGKPTETLWQGSKLLRIDPYNTIYDPRVPLVEQHTKAEFVGKAELMNRVALATFLHSLSWRMNVTKAYESTVSSPTSSREDLYYIPQVFTENLSYSKLMGIMNWDMWAGGGKMLDVKMNYKNLYVVVTRYVRIIPKDFGLSVPNAGSVQIWKLITVNDNVLVYVERLTNAHGYLPMVFGQPIEDGLNLQTKSFAQKQIPMQDIASALANSKFAARRRAVSDRGLYDPSRVAEKDINSDNPAAKIPVKPSIYGQDISKAYYQIPFKDEQNTTVLQEVREVLNYSDNISGQNKAQQGQFVKGNRTKTEYEDISQRSSGRQQGMALSIEHQVFAPVKEILKLDILQYQPAGKIYSTVQNAPVNIDPKQLRETALEFKVSDGMLPSEKLIDSDSLSGGFQVIAQSQQLAMDYDVGGIFAYLMKIKGADIDQFKYSQDQKDANMKRMLAINGAKAKQEAEAQATAKGVPPNGTPV
jgi:hypothetical protein